MSGRPSLTHNAVRAEIARMPSRGSEKRSFGVRARRRQRHTDDTVTSRKNHNRVREEVKGGPAPRGKKHHRYPRQEHKRHGDGRFTFRGQENTNAHINKGVWFQAQDFNRSQKSPTGSFGTCFSTRARAA